MLNQLSSSPSPPTASAAASAAPSFPDQLTFLSTIVGSLKLIKRTGWVRSGVPLPESDADHMHRCALTSMLVTQPPHPDDVTLYETEEFARYDYRNGKVDATKLLRMAVTHDLCESLAGDVTPHCHADLVNSKEAKERAAMEEIRRVVGDPLGEELYGLWREYEDQKTVEAIYCKDIDKFEMVCQAYEYERDHLALNPEGKKKENIEKNDEAVGETLEPKEGEGGENDGKEATDPPAAKKLRTAAEETTTTTTEDEKEKMGASPPPRQKTDDLHLPPKICSETTDGALTSPLRTFFVSTSKVMKTPLFRRLDGEVRTRREELLRRRGWSVTDEERQRYD